MRYTVGMTIGSRSSQVEVVAEDALIAALRAKAERPDALIVYVRKANARGDKRHPHPEASSRGLPRRAKAGSVKASGTKARPRGE